MVLKRINTFVETFSSGIFDLSPQEIKEQSGGVVREEADSNKGDKQMEQVNGTSTASSHHLDINASVKDQTEMLTDISTSGVPVMCSAPSPDVTDENAEDLLENLDSNPSAILSPSHHVDEYGRSLESSSHAENRTCVLDETSGNSDVHDIHVDQVRLNYILISKHTHTYVHTYVRM